VIGGPYSVSGAVIGTLVVTAAREVLRAIENYVNILQIFPEGFFGFTEVVLAIVLIVILIYRPTGILGSQEIRWPPRPRKTGSTDTNPSIYRISGGKQNV